jgi:hypothetical protein
MSGKGSARRPGKIPPGAWDTIFTNVPLICTACNTEPCDCQRTTDGPGQDEARDVAKLPYDPRRFDRE